MCTSGSVRSTNGHVNSLLPKHSKPSIRNWWKKAVQMHTVEISAEFFWFQLSCTCTCMVYLVSLHISLSCVSTVECNQAALT